MAFTRNYTLRYRPLRAGVQVMNPIVGQPGTLGCFATGDGADRWIVSCYHVLCRLHRSVFAPGEPICQPFDPAADAVAKVMLGDSALDCAAALVDNGVVIEPRIVGMPRLAEPAAPMVGMEVIKSGMATGVTEGLIVDVKPDDTVVIDLRTNYPRFTGGTAGYEFCAAGDSGALWVDPETLSPVAMHTGDLPAAGGLGCGVSFPTVLARLGLQFIQ
ncbi:MAG TPA: hypothetical protein VFB66_10115 [Tepidisphaeraceae bacterium]|nr:hypothetical protein [Tepidisphaeraceae bacterium]